MRKKNRRACPFVTDRESRITPSPAHAFVNEAQPFHLGGMKKMVAVENNWMTQSPAPAFQIQLLEFVPLRGDYERIAAFGHGVHVLNENDVVEDRLCFFHRFRIMHAQNRSFLLQ